MKEKFLYLTEKVKELLKFGSPVTSVTLDGATNISDLEREKLKKEGEGTEKIDENVPFNPTKLGEQALNKEIEELKS